MSGCIMPGYDEFLKFLIFFGYILIVPSFFVGQPANAPLAMLIVFLTLASSLWVTKVVSIFFLTLLRVVFNNNK